MAEARGSRPSIRAMIESLSPLALAVGFEMCLYDRHAVARWVDAQIEATEIPRGALLELATLRDKHDLDIVRLLRVLAGEVDDATVAVHELRTLRTQVLEGRVSLSTAVGMAWRFAGRVSREADLAACQLDDEYDLASNGTYGTVADVEARFFAFLDEHAGR